MCACECCVVFESAVGHCQRCPCVPTMGTCTHTRTITRARSRPAASQRLSTCLQTQSTICEAQRVQSTVCEAQRVQSTVCEAQRVQSTVCEAQRVRATRQGRGHSLQHMRRSARLQHRTESALTAPDLGPADVQAAPKPAAGAPEHTGSGTPPAAAGTRCAGLGTLSPSAGLQGAQAGSVQAHAWHMPR